MSLADRFPRLRDYVTPDWVANAEDDDTDLVEAARKSQEEQADRLMGTVALPPLTSRDAET